MRLKTFFAVCLFCVAVLLGTAPSRAAEDDVPQPLTEGEMFAYLEQSIAWYRNVTATDPATLQPRELVLYNNLKSNALKALRLTFDFARLEADILQKEKDLAEKMGPPAPIPQTSVDPSAAQPDMARVKKMIADKIAGLQKDLAETQAQLPRARSTERATLEAKRDKLSVALELAKAQQQLVNEVADSSDKDNEDETLRGQVDTLASTLPELEKKKKTTTTGTTTPSTATTTTGNTAATALTAVVPVPAAAVAVETAPQQSKESKGIIRLISDVVDHMHGRQDMADLVSQTRATADAHDALLSQVREELMAVVRRGNALGEDENATGAKSFELQRMELDALTAHFKELSTIIIPLNDQKKPLAVALRTIEEWQKLSADEMSGTVRQLFFRLATLLIAILIPLGLSEFAHRLTLKYVQDGRRRRQLQVIRRIITMILIALVVILNLMTEFGSLATFVGFVTAGLAVALQNVILSIVAYFFFFGRYGIRAGSRVTVYGTTGEVIETGLVRLYLMELTEEEGKWNPTGRIVAFPNSILFQPTAFFKQIPGARFTQHEIMFPVAADAEPALIQAKLKEGAQAIYDDSRAVLEIQRSALEKSTNIKSKIPRAKGELREINGQKAVVFRYPIPADKAANFDENVIRLLKDVLARDPKLPVDDSDPRITRI